MVYNELFYLTFYITFKLPASDILKFCIYYENFTSNESVVYNETQRLPFFEFNGLSDN